MARGRGGGVNEKQHSAFPAIERCQKMGGAWALAIAIAVGKQEHEY